MNEELKKLAEDYSCQYITQDYIQVSYDSFLCGADAAKDALIKKACEWLEDNLQGGVHPSSFRGFIKDFKKAMEE